MILVDSSVWIDYFRAVDTGPATLLDSLFGRVPLLVGDLIAAEVLQGVASDREFRHVKRVFEEFEHLDLSSYGLAVKASQNYRLLRSKGITIRKTIDTLIATRCIENGISLLHSDRDFDPFVEHLGLRVAFSEINVRGNLTA